MKLEEIIETWQAALEAGSSAHSPASLAALMDISERLQRLESQIYHVNPNCRDSRLCNPHGETGPVTHRAGQGKE